MTTPPDFTVGQVLTAAQMNAVGLWLVNTYTISSASTLQTFTDAFSADFDSYRLVASGLECASVQGLRFRMGTTNTGYYYGEYLQNHSSSAVSGGSNDSSWGVATITADPVTSFVMDLHYPQKSQITTYTAQGSDARTGGFWMRSFSGFLNNTTAYTSFSLTAGANIEAGTVSVYGYRN